MNVFCIILNKKEKELRRISLSQDLQSEIKNYINISPFYDAIEVNFTGEYKPNDEENEVLVINSFNNPHADMLSLSIEKLKDTEIENIKAIIFSDDEYIAYQTFDSRKIITPERFTLIYSKHTYSKIDKKGIVIDQTIDVLYKKSERKLLFKSFHKASRIFDLSDYYREATTQEVNEFLSSGIFSNVSQDIIHFVNRQIRKKIYLLNRNQILDKLKDDEIFKKVADYSKIFGLANYFDKQSNKIIIPEAREDFNKLISFLNEDLFQSPISGDIYETNSKRKLENKKGT